MDKNIHACASSQSLKKIKRCFRANKKNIQSFSEGNFNIVVHVRRPNQHDNRIIGADTPNLVYINCINELRNKYKNFRPKFYICSQGNKGVFEKDFVGSDIVFIINESIEDTFYLMTQADVLVCSQSSFSYTAALISDGEIYYIPFWHTPLPHWKPISYLINKV